MKPKEHQYIPAESRLMFESSETDVAVGNAIAIFLSQLGGYKKLLTHIKNEPFY